MNVDEEIGRLNEYLIGRKLSESEADTLLREYLEFITFLDELEKSRRTKNETK